MLVLCGHYPSQDQVFDVKRSTTHLLIMVASQVLLVLGEANHDHVVCLVEQVDNELCVCSCLYVIVSLSPRDLYYSFVVKGKLG
jgi:hypothetical protein